MRGPAVEHRAPHGIPGLFRDAADRTPDAIACVGAEGAWTYRELEEVSDRLAATLIRRAVPADRPVAVLAHRSPYMVAALLGILKAGLAYLPLATDESADRLALIVATARPSLVVGTTEPLSTWSGPAELDLLDVVPLAEELDAAFAPAPLRPVSPRQPINMYFTSGSTGVPKGVVVPSGGITNRLLWGQRHYRLGADDRVLQKTPYTFDVSGWEIFWPLITGARLVLLDPGAHADPAAIIKTIIEYQVTVCHFVPSMLEEFLRWPDAGGCTSLRHVFCSGEALSPALARACLELLDVRLHNLYGPTEASIEVTYWDSPAGRDAIDDVPIGRAIDNCTLLVLDDEGRPAAEGTVGELHIGGVPLALGYCDRPDLTERVFVPAPAGSGLHRVYRTGDLVSVVDGQIRFHGRRDEQVKIRGVRVEPGEVEAVLREHPGVAECAVLGVGDRAPRLVAFVRPASAAGIPADDCRTYLADRLPGAYVPGTFVVLDVMPLTASGKQDRAALRRQAGALAAPRPAGPAAGQDALARLWAETLGLGAVDEDADFLSLGGHSLAAVRLRGELLRTYGLDVALAELLRGGLTLAALRARAGDARPAPVRRVSPPRRVDRTRAPVSPGQRRLWLMERLYPRLSAYNVVAALRVPGGLEVDRLRAALATVVRRHESLRTRIVEGDSGPYQEIVAAAGAPLTIGVSDAPLDAGRCRALAAEAVDEPLPIDEAPLLRVRYTADPAGDALLVAVLHHVIADQRSVDLFLADLAAAYDGRLGADEPPQFGDVLTDRAGRTGDQADVGYWTARLHDAPRSHGLPFQGRRPLVTTFAGGAVDAVVTGTGAARLDAVARDLGVTPVAVVLAAFATVLTSWSGQDDVVVGVPWSSRDGGPSDQVIGFLVDTLPVRIGVAGPDRFRELVRQVSAALLDAHAHAGADFERIVEALGLTRNLSRNPLYQVWFNDLTHAAPPPSFGGVAATEIEPATTGSLFDLGLYLRRSAADGYRLRLVHAVDVFDRDTAGHLLDQVVRLLDQVPGHLGRAPARWPLGEERPPATFVAPAGRSTVTELFERAAERYAARDALLLPDGRMTYRQLYERVTARAGALRSAGWHDRTVLLPGDRTAGTVVELLAAWRAGCAVALIDGDLPPGRRQAVLAGAGAEAVLAPGAGTGPGTGHPDQAVPVLTGSPLSRPAGDAPVPGFSHVLSTSGTSGAPSMVFVAPDALPEALHHYRDAFGVEPDDRFLLLSAPGHDPVFRDVLTPLIHGAALCVPATTEPAATAKLIARAGITRLNATPGVARLLASAARATGRRFDRLRSIVLSGALLTDPIARELRRCAPAAEIYHGYGTTETPQLSTWLRWRDPAADPVRRRRDRAGVPLAATGPWRELVIEGAGVGQLGEIVVRGRGLALRTHPDRQPSPFAPDPHGRPGVTSYRTGDLGRYTPDGHIEFAGRLDRQVSVAGHRLEPAEIEAALLAQEGIVQCLVVVADTGITAYVARSGAVPVVAEQVRDELRAVLPSWAVPEQIVVLDKLPVNQNGKVDVSAVAAAPADTAPAPSAAIEDVVLATLREQLGGSGHPDPAVSFFEAGLNSLSLLRMHDRLRVHGIAVEVVDLFRFPSPRSLARHLSGAPARNHGGESFARPDPVSLPAVAVARRSVRRRLDDQKRNLRNA
ncbi:hypothetical protein GCM10010199_47730 [Dactylosporangium roseum]